MNIKLSAIRKKLAGQHNWLFVGVAVFAVFIIFMLSIVAAHKTHMYSSDDVAQQTIAAENGKYGQAEAWYGVDNFILKLPFYQITHGLLGQSRTALLVTILIFNAIAFAGIIGALYLVGREQMKGTYKKFTPWILLGLLWVCSLGGNFAMSLINPNVRNAEIGICIFLAVLALQWSFRSGAKWYQGAFIGLIIGIFLFNDPYFLYTLFAALALVPAYYFFFDRKGYEHARSLRIYGVLGVGFLVYKLAGYVANAFNFHVYDANVAFASLTTIGKNITNLATSLLDMFHANFFGMEVSLLSFRMALNAFLTLLFIALLVRHIIKRREVQPHVALFCLTIIITILLYALTTNSDVAGTARYLVLLPFAFIFLLPTFMYELKNQRVKWTLISLLVLAGLSNSYAIVHTVVHPATASNNETLHVVSELNNLHLNKGYGAYWDGNITTYFSHGQALTIPVVCDNGSLRIYYWLMDSAWLQKKADNTYLIINKDEASFQRCNLEKITDQFGAPVRMVVLDAQRTLLVYDYDIYTRMLAANHPTTAKLSKRYHPF